MKKAVGEQEAHAGVGFGESSRAAVGPDDRVYVAVVLSWASVVSYFLAVGFAGWSQVVPSAGRVESR